MRIMRMVSAGLHMGGMCTERAALGAVSAEELGMGFLYAPLLIWDSTK